MDTKQRTDREEARKKRRPSSSAGTASRKRTAARRGKTAASARKSVVQMSEERRRRKASQPVPKERPQRPAPDVVYTPPKPLNRGRFLLYLATVAAVVLALTFSISIFFKVEHITVAGAEKYTAWQIREASGIEDGENLLTYGKTRAIANIKALPYVDEVRMGIKLPDTVNIEITEIDVVYSVKAQDGTWWLITADGEVVEKTDSATAGEYTKIEGIQLSLPQAKTQATAYEPQSTEPSATEAVAVSTQPPVRASEKLSTALTILQHLEKNGIIGEATVVDVSDIANLQIWYGKQYQVKLGDTTQLAYKITSMGEAVAQLDDYHAGVLDITFTTWPDEVGYTPFT